MLPCSPQRPDLYRGAGAGGQGGNCPPPNFLSQWDGYACAHPPPPNFFQSLGISTFLPPPQKKIVPAPLDLYLRPIHGRHPLCTSFSSLRVCRMPSCHTDSESFNRFFHISRPKAHGHYEDQNFQPARKSICADL